VVVVGLAKPLITGLAAALIADLVTWPELDLPSNLAFRMIFGIRLALFTGVIVGTIAGLIKLLYAEAMEIRISPNQGTLRCRQVVRSGVWEPPPPTTLRMFKLKFFKWGNSCIAR